MWKLLVTNNIKSGYNCDCVSAPNVGHILFVCPIIKTIRKEQLQNVVREMQNYSSLQSTMNILRAYGSMQKGIMSLVSRDGNHLMASLLNGSIWEYFRP